jgi:hypothetical protein
MLNPYKKRDLKQTPAKNEESIFGTAQWCAAMLHCCNSKTPAESDYKCQICHNYTHFTCMDIRHKTTCVQCAKRIETPLGTNSKEDGHRMVTPNSTGTKLDTSIEIQFGVKDKSNAVDTTMTAEIPDFDTRLPPDTSMILTINSRNNSPTNETQEVVIGNGSEEIGSNSFETIEDDTFSTNQVKSLMEAISNEDTKINEANDDLIQAMFIVMGKTIPLSSLITTKMEKYLNEHQTKCDDIDLESDSCIPTITKLSKICSVKKGYWKCKTQVQVLRKRQDVVRIFKQFQYEQLPLTMNIGRLAEVFNIFFDQGSIVPSDKSKLIQEIKQAVENKEWEKIRIHNSSVQLISQYIQNKEHNIKSVDQSSPNTNSAKAVQFVTANKIPNSNKTSIVKPSDRVTVISSKAKHKPKIKPILKQNNISRIEFRLNMVAHSSDTSLYQHLQRQLQEVVDILVKHDRFIKFLPWFDNNEQTPLFNNKVPLDIRQANRYFQRVRPKESGFTYGEFKIQHSRQWEDIIYEVTPWLTQCRHGLYYQKVQCQKTVNVGWLLWSFRRIDPVIVEEEIFSLYGYNIQLRYQNINSGNPQDNTDIVRALHVIADQKDADKIATLFQKIYNFKTTHFPLGITMRFVPHLLRVSKSKQYRLSKWRYKQKVFSSAIESVEKPMSTTNWEIMNLDKEITEFGSLRKAIMRIATKDNENEALFLSVDTSFFRSNETIFTFLPKHESEARTFVSNIVPYFFHQYDKSILKHIFQEESLVRASNSTWNPETQEVISNTDLYIEQSGDMEDDFDILDIMGSTQLKSEQHYEITDPEILRVQRLFTGEDSTSVGTFFTNGDKPTNYDSIDRNIGTSTVVTQTMTSSLTNGPNEPEERITKMSEEIQNLRLLLQSFIYNQNSSNRHKQDSEWLNKNNVQPNQFNAMETQDTTTLTKRKAGDSEESACRET